MAKDLNLTAGDIAAFEFSSNQKAARIEAGFKLWEKKSAKRAAKGAALSTTLFTLAACGGSSGPAITDSANLSDNVNSARVQGTQSGATIEISDITTDRLNATVIAQGVKAEGDVLTFNFADENDLIVLSSNSKIKDFSVIQVVSGTVDFKALGENALDGITLQIGSGAIVSAEQALGLTAVELREGATTGKLQIDFSGVELTKEQFADIFEKIAGVEGVEVSVKNADELSSEQLEQLEEAGILIEDDEEDEDETVAEADEGETDEDDSGTDEQSSGDSSNEIDTFNPPTPTPTPTPTESKAFATVDINLFAELQEIVPTDIENAETYLVQFFANSEGTGLADTLSGLSFDQGEMKIDISSNSIQFTSKDGEKITLSMTDFSPSEFQEVKDVVEKFLSTGNFADLTISGGFNSLEVSDGSGKVIATLTHQNDGFVLGNPLVGSGFVNNIKLEGSFSNQISDYINLIEKLDDLLYAESTDIYSIFADLEQSLVINGISASSSNSQVLRVGRANDQEGIQITIGGAEGKDHVVSLSISGVDDLLDSFLTAAGGIDGVLELFTIGWAVEANGILPNGALENIEDFLVEYFLYQGIASKEQELRYFDDEVEVFVSYLREEITGVSKSESFGILATEDQSPFVDFVYLPEFWNSHDFGFFTKTGEALSNEEFIRLYDRIEDVQKALGFDGNSIGDLSFSLTYSYGDETVIDIKITDLPFLLNYEDDILNDLDFYGNNDFSIVRNDNSGVELKLLGVSIDDLLGDNNAEDEIIALLQKFLPISTGAVPGSSNFSSGGVSPNEDEIGIELIEMSHFDNHILNGESYLA